MITVRGLTKSFDDYQALNDLSINVKTGSIYGLVGTNGSGKTTLIKNLTGVLKPDSGEILFDGNPVFENDVIKGQIGYIPDDLSFFSPYTMKDAAKYYRSIYPVWDEERFQGMSEKFGFSHKKKLQNFSKGMQKQAAFILTMCTHPKYLILDEPIDGLDPLVRKTVYNYIIEDISQEDMSVIISSHNLREMDGICDSIGILDKGGIRIERDLDELKADIHKVQVAFSNPSSPEDRYKSLNVIHRESRGSVELLIIKDEGEKVRRVIGENKPLIFDMLPLTLEEIFIYELGGDDYEIKDILL